MPLLQSKGEDPEVGKEVVRAYNTKSQSNGSLMRATPMAVFISKLKDVEPMMKAVKADVEFTHCNKIVTEAIFLYCYTIALLIQNHDDDDRAAKVF